MLYCVTDIGSNTVKMNIFDSSGAAGGNIKSVFAESTTLGLGGMRENGVWSGFGIKALCEILERYKYNSSENGCGNFFAFATASLRNVTNTEDAVEIIRGKNRNFDRCSDRRGGSAFELWRYEKRVSGCLVRAYD